MEEAYQDTRKRIASFVFNEIDNGELTDTQIAKILLDVSMNYLKRPNQQNRDCYNQVVS